MQPQTNRFSLSLKDIGILEYWIDGIMGAEGILSIKLISS